MMDKRPDLLYGPHDTLLAYLVAEVIPTLRTVSRDKTANYYHRLREGVESGSWQANAVVHKLWPDDGSPPDKRVKLDGTRPQRGVKSTAAPQQTIIGQRSKWDQSLATMHIQKCRTPRSEPEDAHQARAGRHQGCAPGPDHGCMGMTWAEEITTAPEAINPDTRADDHIEQLQAWFIQETEKDMQEETSDEDRDHHRSSPLWQLYQRKVAVARTTRPWKGRIFALGQLMEGPRTSDARYWTNG